MNRSEFLQELTKALRNDLSESFVQENVNFYNNYISEEARKGRAESEILDELGDPWIIARTAIEAAENRGQGYAYETSELGSKSQQKNEKAPVNMFGLDTVWKKILVLVVIGVILISFLGIVSGIVRLIAPIAIPIILVTIIIKMFKKRR